MHAVIFRAEIKKTESRYSEMASQMRNLAINTYGCKEFSSVTEGTQEIAISYWENQGKIQRRKLGPAGVCRKAHSLYGAERLHRDNIRRPANKGMHLTAFQLRSISAGDANRYGSMKV